MVFLVIYNPMTRDHRARLREDMGGITVLNLLSLFKITEMNHYQIGGTSMRKDNVVTHM